MKTKITLLTLMAVILSSCSENKFTTPDLTVSNGNILRFHVFNQGFGDTLTVDVWTPDGYDKSQKYPVLYMHDGQMLFDAEKCWNGKSWEMDDTTGRLIAEDSIRPIIIVGIHNLPTRLGDYLPQQYYDLMADGGEKDEMNKFFNKPFRGDAYINAIVNNIKPFIDKEFSTDPSLGATCIAGSSMGGLISLYAICAYPEVFGSAMLISTHFSTSTERPELADAMLKYTMDNMPLPENHKIYIDNGTEPCDNAYIPFFWQAVGMFKAAGYDSTNLLYKEFPGHSHSEEFWAKRMNFPLKFIFSSLQRTQRTL